MVIRCRFLSDCEGGLLVDALDAAAMDAAQAESARMMLVRVSEVDAEGEREDGP